MTQVLLRSDARVLSPSLAPCPPTSLSLSLSRSPMPCRTQQQRAYWQVRKRALTKHRLAGVSISDFQPPERLENRAVPSCPLLEVLGYGRQADSCPNERKY